jgi:hypothetical protein
MNNLVKRMNGRGGSSVYNPEVNLAVDLNGSQNACGSLLAVTRRAGIPSDFCVDLSEVERKGMNILGSNTADSLFNLSNFGINGTSVPATPTFDLAAYVAPSLSTVPSARTTVDANNVVVTKTAQQVADDIAVSNLLLKRLKNDDKTGDLGCNSKACIRPAKGKGGRAMPVYN